MRERLTDAEARRAIAEGGSAALWQIACAIDRKGASFADGLPADRVADLLEIAETENWPRSGRKEEPTAELFKRMCVMPKDDGKLYRSLLPDDLSDAEENLVRAFASSSKHALVRAHFSEILWVRFKKYPDAVAAIDARLEAAPGLDPDDDWPTVVRNLGRVTTLVLAVSARTKLPDVVAALDTARGVLISSKRPFAYPVLADMLCGTLLARKDGREAFTENRAADWEADLVKVASTYRADPHHGHDAVVVVRTWVSRWHGADRVREAGRDVVAQLQEVAAACEPGIAPMFRERALQAALDFGLADLTHATRHELMESVKAAIPTFKQFSGRFDLPPELIREVDTIVERSADTAQAIRQMALLPGLLEIDKERFRGSATDQLKDTPLLALMPSAQYHPDGKVTHRTDGGAANLEQHVARLVGMHLALVEALLRHFLAAVAGRVEPTSLSRALGQWPHLPPARARILEHASERFAAGDAVSAGYIAATQFEAVLRDLLRAGGCPALKAEREGTLMDETLNSLLRGEPARQVLGVGFCSLAEYVLCDHALGWNLRNEVAHGTVRAEALSLSRVLLLWLLIVRPTCYTVTTPGPGAVDTDAPADGGGP